MSGHHRWSHPICNECWWEREKREPIMLRRMYRVREDCCWCGKPTIAGIYLREDPTLVPRHREAVS